MDSIDAIQGAEQTIIEFENGPSWLTVDPVDEATVELAACHTYGGAKNPAERIEVDRVQHVRRDAWRDAVTDIACDFTETVTDLNSELTTHEVLVKIQNQIQNIK